MKTSEYFIVAGVSVLAVYLANMFMKNITVHKNPDGSVA